MPPSWSGNCTLIICNSGERGTAALGVASAQLSWENHTSAAGDTQQRSSGSGHAATVAATVFNSENSVIVQSCRNALTVCLWFEQTAHKASLSPDGLMTAWDLISVTHCS